MEHYVTIKGLPQTIRPDESTAFTGKEIRILAKLTGLVDKGRETPKDYLRKNLEEGYNKKCFKMLIEYNENNGLLKCKKDAVRISLWSNTKNGNTRLVENITEYTICYFSKTGDASRMAMSNTIICWLKHRGKRKTRVKTLITFF